MSELSAPLIVVLSPHEEYQQLIVVDNNDLEAPEVNAILLETPTHHLDNIIITTAEEQEAINKIPNVSNHQCKICHRKFNNRQNISRHMIKIHKIRRGREVSSKTIACNEIGCNTNFASVKDLKVHLVERHAFKFCDFQQEFSSFKEFDEWKKKFEATNNVSFVQHSGLKSWCTKNVIYYYCHKSGDFESQSKGRRTRRTCKVGFSCTATMKVSVDKQTKKVVVYLCNDHYGH